MKDDGYKPMLPGDNDRGFHHGHTIEKPLNRTDVSAGTDIKDPGITTNAPSKPSWPPGRGVMRP
jgi:hypothetical protein